MTKHYAFIIPSYNPDYHLLDVVQDIRQQSGHRIFIIDDGSNESSQDIFQELGDLNDENIILLKHAINMGKGAALKTVFNHILTVYPDIEGVVTLDSDGQHLTEDCMRVLHTLEDADNGFVLGYREFSTDIPLKSYMGNTISKFIYKIILGKQFKDTQTGLRGLNKAFMKVCLKIKSNRFEFETEQLALVVNRCTIIEIPIETVYISENKASSFRPLVDSFRIYFVLFRYGLSSIITAVVDFIVFMIAVFLDTGVFTANILARTVSIGVQFNLLDKFVFNTRSKWKSFILFVLYVYSMGMISALIQMKLIESLHISVLVVKVVVEGILFFVNFAFLRLYIFTKK